MRAPAGITTGLADLSVLMCDAFRSIHVKLQSLHDSPLDPSLKTLLMAPQWHPGRAQPIPHPPATTPHPSLSSPLIPHPSSVPSSSGPCTQVTPLCTVPVTTPLLPPHSSPTPISLYSPGTPLPGTSPLSTLPVTLRPLLLPFLYPLRYPPGTYSSPLPALPVTPPPRPLLLPYSTVNTEINITRLDLVMHHNFLCVFCAPLFAR